MDWGTLLSVAIFVLLCIVMMRGCGGMMGGGGCGMGRDSRHSDHRHGDPDNQQRPK